MPTAPVALPLPLACQDPSGPFALQATVTAWTSDPGPDAPITLTLGHGTLHDADKGRFALHGLVLQLRLVDGTRYEPVAVLRPGVLTEFQQAGLLDAVAGALNARPHS